MKIYKYKLIPKVAGAGYWFKAPKNLKIVSLQRQYDDLCVWAEVDEYAKPEPQHIHLHMTGSTPSTKHITTMIEGAMVYHFYQVLPQFKHDCSLCSFLGRSRDGKADLYYCSALTPTVIARESSKDPDYQSGLASAEHVPVLKEALDLAKEMGYHETV